ncbi:protein of unknown function (plasmid) [Cupriavidus taiwanensis]|uniref:Uncharacterized protein n=1 Tax=Cupriavidus taiwanensis TaxID=164546 RepID=A0A375IW27_9BURK|nr:protein of unknown function [Cupriavidus taiwanensis]
MGKGLSPIRSKLAHDHGYAACLLSSYWPRLASDRSDTTWPFDSSNDTRRPRWVTLPR